MSDTMIPGIILTILGLVGTLKFSAIFFGFFTVGLFLISFNYQKVKRQARASLHNNMVSSHNTCPNCRMVIGTTGTYCPTCGTKVREE